MVKPPKIRHSKSRKEPVTIDLEPGEVSRIDEPQAAAETASAPADAAPTEAAAEPAVDTELPVSEAPADETGTAAEAEENNSFFMGSEAPPEPSHGEQQPVAEEERVRHAFGRDPDTPPPFGTARADARASAESPIRPAATPERKGSGLSAIAAGIVGGVIALLGAGGLQFAGLLPSPGTSVAVPASDDAAIAAVKAELAALKQQVDTVKAAPDADTAKLSQSVTDLTSGVQGVSSALDQVKADVAALKSAVESGSAGDGAAVQALNSKVTELEASVKALGQSGQGVSQEAIDAIDQKIAEVSAAALAAADAAKAGEGRLAALEQSVAGLSDQIARQAAQPKVALAIAAAALKSAIERGGTFTAEVDTFAAIAPDAPELPALRDIAAKGIASRSDLVAEADEAANAMIAASETVSDDASFWDRLLASAESLIKVRPIGAVEGETVPAKVARMEVAVKSGDFTKAIAEYETLPATSKAAGQGFADKINARLAAEALVAKALAGALKSA
jgi:hypothetical protein